jgi:deoxyribonuclease-4
MTVKPEKLLIGAHTSAAGGVQNALLQGQAIGATTIQLFTSNQKQWKGKQFNQEEIALWNDTLQETGLREIMSHDSYLINLGSPDKEGLEKSRKAFAEEVQRCVSLGISYLNFHPGAALKESRQQCLDIICYSLIEVEKQLFGSKTTLLLETTAGQGSAVGCRFDEIGYIIDKVKKIVPVGVCIDTCHIFVAGYDVRDEKAWDLTLTEFDKFIGLKYLRAFHMNDSSKGLGSRVDRHKPLGDGEIGIDCFKFLMKDPRTRDIPKYLETPDGPPLWEKEIKMLREFASHAHKN